MGGFSKAQFIKGSADRISQILFVRKDGSIDVNLLGLGKVKSTAVVFAAGDILVVHVVVDIPTDEIRFYVNGVSQAFSVTLGAMTTDSAILKIGTDGIIYWDGKVGGLVIWDVPLNFGQVVDDYEEVRHELGL